MDKKSKRTQSEKVKSFQEIAEEISIKPNLKEKQTTPQPKDYDEIEY